MTNAQEWLNKHYPKNKRNYGEIEIKRRKITSLDIRKQNLSGSLDLSDFTNLEALNCEVNYLSSLQLNNNSKLTTLDCSFNKELTTLQLENNKSLQCLSCYGCQLTSLNVRECEKLESLDIRYNQLTNLILPENGEEIISIFLSSNQLTFNLSIFSHLKNLETLTLDNNPLTGSLKSLQKLESLESLSIENINLNIDLEYLPESVNAIYCNNESVVKLLKNYARKDEEEGEYYDYQVWRESHPELIERSKTITELETEITKLDEAFSELKEEINKEEIFLIKQRRKQFINYCWLESDEITNNNIQLLLREITKRENSIQPYIKTENTRKALAIFVREKQSKINKLKNQDKEYYQTKIEVLAGNFV